VKNRFKKLFYVNSVAMKKRRVKLGYHPGTALERSVMDLCSEKREGGSVFQMISGLPKPSKSSTARSNPW
jgi:hypothetical protein